MVSFKGKTTKTSGNHILEDFRASKNHGVKDFKIYSVNEKSNGGPCESGDGSSWRTGRKLPTESTRKSVPANAFAKGNARIGLNDAKGKVLGAENVMAKCNNSVKVKTGRKALADVSNVNNAKSSQLKTRLSSGPKLMKDKVEGSSLLQGKISSGKNHCGPRISLGRSVVVTNASSRKSVGVTKSAVFVNTSSRKSNGENVKGSSGIMGKHNISVGSMMGRKVLTEINSGRNCRRSTSSDGSKFIKNQTGKLLQSSKLSLATQKVMDADTSTSKLVKAVGSIMHKNSNAKRTSMFYTVEKSITIVPAENKKEEAPMRQNCDDSTSVISQECSLEKLHGDGSHCSSDTVTAVISIPKRNRRKSYTLSLMAKSEVLGECADTLKKDKLPNIDDSLNPLEVVEYVDDIYQYYWSMEIQNPSLANYMSIQSDITPRMRGVLINWLIEVHLKFELMQETLFLMVELLDRVLSIINIKKNDLQIVGLTALLLASKYEDFWHPKIDELISISANLYTRDQMLAMEKLILTKLRFRLNIPTPYVFMLRFLKASQSDRKLEHLAFYLIELCLVEYEALKFKPSLLCASAIYIARCTMQIAPAWTGLLRKHTRYEESQLRACADMILGLQRAAGLKPAKFTYDKFLKSDRCSVAAIKAIDQLPL